MMLDVAEMSAIIRTEKCPLHLAIEITSDLHESSSDEVITMRLDWVGVRKLVGDAEISKCI